MFHIRTKYLLACLAGALCCGNAASAISINLGSDTPISSPYTVTSSDGVDVTFRTGPGDNGLQLGSSTLGLTGGGICSHDSVYLLGLYVGEACTGQLDVSFSEGVDNLTFSMSGIAVLPTVSGYVVHDGGITAFSDGSLIGLSLLGNGIGFDFSDYEGLTAIVLDTNVVLALGDGYYNAFDFEASDTGGPVPGVPVPFTLPLAASAFGALGVLRLRRKTGTAA